jgi:hypothetical protein
MLFIFCHIIIIIIIISLFNPADRLLSVLFHPAVESAGPARNPSSCCRVCSSSAAQAATSSRIRSASDQLQTLPSSGLLRSARLLWALLYCIVAFLAQQQLVLLLVVVVVALLGPVFGRCHGVVLRQTLSGRLKMLASNLVG